MCFNLGHLCFQSSTFVGRDVSILLQAIPRSVHVSPQERCDHKWQAMVNFKMFEGNNSAVLPRLSRESICSLFGDCFVIPTTSPTRATPQEPPSRTPIESMAGPLF